MNKKKLAILIVIGVIILLFLSCFVIGIVKGIIFVIPDKSLRDIDLFEVDKALATSEMTGEEILQKRYSVRQLFTQIATSKEDHWDEIEKSLEEMDKLYEELQYRGDISDKMYMIYNFDKYGIHFFGYVLTLTCMPSGTPRGLGVDYESEIEKRRNELEILRENLISKKSELNDLVGKRDIKLFNQISNLLQETGYHKYYERRDDFRYFITFYKLKNGSSLEILPSWEEGEHLLSDLKKYHVWIGMYNTEKPGIDNFLGSFTTDEFTSDMNKYWEEALKRNPETKSIRIKWIYVSEDHKIVWEGNKNGNEEWYTFAKYEGEPAEGTYDVVNMNVLDYPDFQQYYVVSFKPKKSFNIII